MRCETIHEQIQDWLDTQGVQVMPEDVREHVRDCGNCREFIRRWNSIEVGLQSFREQYPAPSPDFAYRLQERLQGGNPRPRSIKPLIPWRFAAAGLSSLALLAILLLLLSNSLHFSSQSAQHNTATFSLPRTPQPVSESGIR